MMLSKWVATELGRTYLLTGFPWVLLGYSQAGVLPVVQVASVVGQLQLEAHSLINLLIGGLFAVIALNLSVNTRYTALSAGDIACQLSNMFSAVATSLPRSPAPPATSPRAARNCRPPPSS